MPSGSGPGGVKSQNLAPSLSASIRRAISAVCASRGLSAPMHERVLPVGRAHAGCATWRSLRLSAADLVRKRAGFASTRERRIS